MARSASKNHGSDFSYPAVSDPFFAEAGVSKFHATPRWPKPARLSAGRCCEFFSKTLTATRSEAARDPRNGAVAESIENGLGRITTSRSLT